MSWIAENAPWHQVSKDGPRMGMTDEDYAMSAPIEYGTYEFEASAREEVALRLEEISRFDYIATYYNPKTYSLAAEAIRQGVDGVRIAGRYWRVRES